VSEIKYPFLYPVQMTRTCKLSNNNRLYVRAYNNIKKNKTTEPFLYSVQRDRYMQTVKFIKSYM